MTRLCLFFIVVGLARTSQSMHLNLSVFLLAIRTSCSSADGAKRLECADPSALSTAETILRLHEPGCRVGQNHFVMGADVVGMGVTDENFFRSRLRFMRIEP